MPDVFEVLLEPGSVIEVALGPHAGAVHMRTVNQLFVVAELDWILCDPCQFPTPPPVPVRHGAHVTRNSIRVFCQKPK
eukprot:3183660-Rhodomonas_salina.1